MCELLAMSSRNATTLTFSLEDLAAHSRAPGNTRDGWGVAFFEGRDAALFREPQAAAESALIRLLESGGPSTKLALSHIRHATHGDIRLANTQPFLRELAGHAHAFAHNGDLAMIEQDVRVSSARYRPIGQTDSEYAFCALLERMQHVWCSGTAVPSLADRTAVVRSFAQDLRKLGPANFIYADGDALFAYGDRRIQSGSGMIAPPGLFWHAATSDDPSRSIDVDGISVAPGFEAMMLIASVPLRGRQWRAFAQGEVVVVRGGTIISVAE